MVAKRELRFCGVIGARAGLDWSRDTVGLEPEVRSVPGVWIFSDGSASQFDIDIVTTSYLTVNILSSFAYYALLVPVHSLIVCPSS